MMNNKGTVVLNTKRLTLRPFKVEEYEKIFNNYCCDSRVAKYVTWYPHKDFNETKQLVTNWVSQYNDLEFYNWQIVLKENQEPIGSIAIVNINKDLKQMELGYCLAYDQWNKGLVTEGVSEVIKFLFDEVCVNSVIARHDSRNIGSGKVMQKCNMQYIGTLSDTNKGEEITLFLYEITRENYYTNN